MAKRAWELINNPKNKRWFIQIGAGTKTESYPSIQEIKDYAKEKGIDTFSLQSDLALEKNIHKALEAAGEEFSFPIVIDLQFDVRLIITPDKTCANLYIRKAADKNNQIDLKLVSNLINNSHLKGMDPVKIKDTLNAFRSSPAMELNDFIIAEGIHAGRGKDRTLVPQVDWLGEEETATLCGQLSVYFKQSAICETARIAHAIKGAFVFELSPVELGTPGMDVFGKEIPGLPGNDPFFQIKENISITAGGLKADKSGLLVMNEEKGVPTLRIIPFLDGKATAVVTPDNMSTSLILESEEGAGTPLSLALALSTLAQKGIRGKIDTELIEKTITDVRSSRKSTEIVVLRGLKPVKSGSSRISWHVNFTSESNKVNIASGESILTIEKLTAGADGNDVFGKELKAALAVNETIPEHDDTILPETNNATQIYVAGKSGELTFAGNKLAISDTKEITGDIDAQTGDISFPGNLVLTGNIKAGRSVRSAGRLTINGDAEAALVSANDSVIMNGGIRGSGRGTVWAKKTIQISFAENALLLAGQDITIEKHCFQCTVKTNGMHLMKGNPAILLGGTIKASRGIEVFELGSEKTIRTSISFGQNYLISDQIEVCEREVQQIQETIKRLDADMKKMATNNPSIQGLRTKKFDLMKKNEKLTVKIFMLKEQFETHIISHVKIENTIYPGVILESHGRYYEVREQKTHVIFIFDQKTGQITCSPIESI